MNNPAAEVNTFQQYLLLFMCVLLLCLPLTRKKTATIFFSFKHCFAAFLIRGVDHALQSHPCQGTCVTDAEIEAPEGKWFTLRPVAGSNSTCCPVGTKLPGGTSSLGDFSRLPYGYLLVLPVQTYLSLSNYSGPAANVQFLTLQHI